MMLYIYHVEILLTEMNRSKIFRVRVAVMYVCPLVCTFYSFLKNYSNTICYIDMQPHIR